jgi:putative addiction module killer protein
MEIVIYKDASGREPLVHWLKTLKDPQARQQIWTRIARIQLGSFGDCKPLRGGVLELRIDRGPGYRVYFSRQGPVVVLLLCGSDKGDQSRVINDALAYLSDWKARGES